jgi:hypothetical protein
MAVMVVLLVSEPADRPLRSLGYTLHVITGSCARLDTKINQCIL